MSKQALGVSQITKKSKKKKAMSFHSSRDDGVNSLCKPYYASIPEPSESFWSSNRLSSNWRFLIFFVYISLCVRHPGLTHKKWWEDDFLHVDICIHCVHFFFLFVFIASPVCKCLEGSAMIDLVAPLGLAQKPFSPVLPNWVDPPIWSPPPNSECSSSSLGHAWLLFMNRVMHRWSFTLQKIPVGQTEGFFCVGEKKLNKSIWHHTFKKKKKQCTWWQ